MIAWPDRDDRLDEELRLHLEQQIAKQIRAGMTPDEARRAALVKLGGLEQTREAARDEFRGAWLADFARDLRIGLRALRRVPSFAATAVLTFALGIGAAAAMFSVFDGVLLRPLPYPESDRIVRLYQLGETGRRGNLSEPNFNDWRDSTRSFRIGHPDGARGGAGLACVVNRAPSSSIGVPRRSTSVANPCRTMCGFPVTSAISNTRRLARCHSATAESRIPFPVQTKYALSRVGSS